MVFIPLQITHHRKFTNIDCGKRNIGEIPGRWTKMWFLPIWVKFYRISITPGLFSGSQFGTPKSFFTSLSIFLLPTILACLRQSWPKISQLFCHVLPTSSAIDPVFFGSPSRGWAMVSYGKLLFFQLFQHQIGGDLRQLPCAVLFSTQRDQDHCQSLRIFNSVFFVGYPPGSIKHC